jgi:uncharacterized protein (DUF58 family)
MADEAPEPKKRRRRRPSALRLNSRGWVYLVLTFSVAFAAGFKGNNLLFAIFSCLFGVFVVSGALTFVVARRMELARSVPEAVHAGEIFTVGVRIRNAKRLWPAFCLRIDDRLTHEGRPAPLPPTPVWLPYARPGARIRGSYYLSAQERGWAKLGPFTVTSEFIPGLFTYRCPAGGEDPLLVLPRLGVLTRRVLSSLLARMPDSELVSPSFQRGTDEFAGLRDYRPGDPPRDIHWKMSARVPGRLLVREYEDPRVRDAAILLDTFLPNPNDARRRQRLERAVTFAGTLADALLAEGYRLRFRAFVPEPCALDLEPRRGALDELLYALAVLKSTRVHSLADLLRQDEGGREDEISFVLRTGDEPLPPWEGLRRAVVIDASDMKNLMHLPD